MVMVTESLDIDPFIEIGLIFFSKSQISKKNVDFQTRALYMVMVTESYE